MITAKAHTTEGGTIFFITLSREDIDALQRGLPLMLANENEAHNLPQGWSIRVSTAESHQEMLAQLQRAGFVNAETKLGPLARAVKVKPLRIK